MITYIRAWQNIINRNAFQKYGSIAFEFNTYIISALVIFYLQLHQKLKTIDDIQTIVTTAQVHDVARSDLPNDMARFLDYLYEFFYMYGERYQNWNHVMSCHIGRWQERRIQPEQRVFTPNQKRCVVQNGNNKKSLLKKNSSSVLSCSFCCHAAPNVSNVYVFVIVCCCLIFFQIARWH